MLRLSHTIIHYATTALVTATLAISRRKRIMGGRRTKSYNTADVYLYYIYTRLSIISIISRFQFRLFFLMHQNLKENLKI